MREAYAKRPMCDHFGQGEVGCFDVEVTLDDLQIGRDAPKEFVCIFISDVAET